MLVEVHHLGQCCGHAPRGRPGGFAVALVIVGALRVVGLALVPGGGHQSGHCVLRALQPSARCSPLLGCASLDAMVIKELYLVGITLQPCLHVCGKCILAVCSVLHITEHLLGAVVAGHYHVALSVTRVEHVVIGVVPLCLALSGGTVGGSLCLHLHSLALQEQSGSLPRSLTTHRVGPHG